MKISIGTNIKEGPWGGGNLFAINLTQYLEKKGHAVINHLDHEDIDLILLTEPRKTSESSAFTHMDIFKYQKLVNRNVLVVHRVNECDERKKTNFVNKYLIEANRVADSTVFVSTWLKNLFINQGLKNDNLQVILSGANAELFNDENTDVWTAEKPLKIVTHHWGANWNKGFTIYKKLDELLAKSEYKEKLEFTYIGNLPPKFKFQNSSVVKPLSGRALANEVKNHHAYLTGSLNEPSGNHHIEGAQCGLPILYIDSGGIPEYCENYGLMFTENNFETMLQEFIINFSKLKSNMHTYPHDSDQMCSEYENLFIKLLDSREQIVKVRKTPYRINILDQIIYLISRKLNLEFKKFKVRFSK
jgi:glycosyltransferase involved in cell wall biosynthesis